MKAGSRIEIEKPPVIGTTENRQTKGVLRIKLKDLLVWSDAATRNGAIIAVDAGISLAFLGTSTSLVRNVNYFTAF